MDNIRRLLLADLLKNWFIHFKSRISTLLKQVEIHITDEFHGVVYTVYLTDFYDNDYGISVMLTYDELNYDEYIFLTTVELRTKYIQRCVVLKLFELSKNSSNALQGASNFERLNIPETY